MYDPESLPKESADISLEEAISKLRGVLQPDGSDEWEIDPYSISFRKLLEWSEREALFYEGFGHQREGGFPVVIDCIPAKLDVEARAFLDHVLVSG